MRTLTFGILLSLLLAACGVNDPLEVAAPQVVDMHPAPGSAGVTVATTVRATFDAAVDPAWVAGSFTLTNASGSTTVVDVSFDETTYTVTITPSAPLAYDSVYEAAFSTGLGVQSAVGALAEDVAWTFSTESAPSDGGTSGDTDGSAGGETGGGPGSETGDVAGGTGNTDAGDPVSTCDAFDCTFENVTLTDTAVPANATWTLENVTIEGAFEIGAGAIVHATNLVVNGKLEASGAAELVLTGSTVTGKMELKYGGTVHVTATSAGADVEIKGQSGSVHFGGNDVQLLLDVNANAGGVELVGNTVGTDLLCSANEPDPVGGDNTAGGAKLGECASL